MAQLRHHEAELKTLGVQVLTVTFSTEHWARGWLQETGSPFPLLFDPERAVYGAYRLRRSRLRAWGPNVLWHNFKLLRAGKPLLPAQGNAHQMGGDFVVDAEGIIRLAHRSLDSLDRPSMESLVSVLRALA